MAHARGSEDTPRSGLCPEKEFFIYNLNSHAPRIAIGPYAEAHCRLLESFFFIMSEVPL